MVQIKSLGALGDGIFKEDGNDVFVPFALPGDDVQLIGNGPRRELTHVDTPSPHRIEPTCEHFGVCGGCQMQHADENFYIDWKKWIVTQAFKRHNIDAKIETYFSAPVGSRRRVVFSARRIDGGLELGFSQRDTNELVNLNQCPVLTGKLESSLGLIKEFAATLPLGKKQVHIWVVDTTNGLDVCVQGMREPNSALRKALVRKAVEVNFARLSIDEEILVERKKPILEMGIAEVVANPGGFLQASMDAELHMVSLVCDHLAKCKQVADLYCGIGTFSLRLAERSKVWALEESSLAIDALDQAWRQTAGKLKQITAETRNLERRPVGFQELKKFDGLVFDPPRAGAEIQSKQLAKTKVKKIAAVSCNPATLAKDLSILMDGGYELKALHAIDQFLFTPHIELVALLEKT